MYDRYQPPTEPEPDDAAPKWEAFEPRAPSDVPTTVPTPPAGRNRRRARGAAGRTATVPGSGFGRLIAGIVGVMVVGGFSLGISQSVEDDPHDRPAGWDACVEEEAEEILQRGGSLLQPEDLCATQFPDYDWEGDPSYQPYFPEDPDDPRF